MMSTISDAKAFSDQGILALRGFLPRKLTAQAREAILSELDRLNLRTQGKIFSSKIKDLPIFQQTGHLSRMIGSKPEVDRLFSNDMIAIMNDLAGSKLKPAQPQSQILLSLPHKTEWSLRNLNWHLDLKVPKTDHIPGLQAFVLIDDVEPQGGATLALAGSHRLHYISYNESGHGILKTKSDFTSTPERYLEPQLIEGIPLQIIEMSGRAGDVYIMDLRILHTPSMNAKRNIRMMATNRYLR